MSTEQTPIPAKRGPRVIEAVTPTAKRGTTVIQREQAPNLQKIYEIPYGGGIVCKIKSEATVYDRETREVRGIRYCPNEPAFTPTSRATTHDASTSSFVTVC